jgi:hypothetical protein
MSVTDKWHVITINRESYHDPKNSLKIDDKVIEGTRSVKIEYGINEPYPVITIEFSARKLNAQIKSNHLKIKKEATE